MIQEHKGHALVYVSWFKYKYIYVRKILTLES